MIAGHTKSINSILCINFILHKCILNVLCLSMRPIDYFQQLDEDQKLSYAHRAGCSIHHMRLNLFVKSGVKKLPRTELLVGLVAASEGHVSLDEAIDYFLVQPVKKLAAELDSSQGQTRAAGQAGEVKGFDAFDKPRLLGRFVGRDGEKMNVGVGL